MGALAVANSRLVAAYVAADPKVRALAITLKAWARARDINDRSRGTLSSFALTLMLIHFLQRQLLLPSLQDLAAVRGEPPVNLMGADCRYCTDQEAIDQEIMQLRNG